MTRRLSVAAPATLLLLVATTLSLSAQQVPKRLFIRAVNDLGSPVLNLTAADLEVTENGSKREVTKVALGKAPLRIVLLVDSSTAVSPVINQFRSALDSFVDALPPEHEVTLISTGGQIRVRVPPTTDHVKLKTEIAHFASEGGANAMVDTLIESDKRFLKTAAPGQWPVFVILTTDNGEMRREPSIDPYNRFMNDFVARGGAAHAVILAGKEIGPVTDIVLNLVENANGKHTAINTAFSLPDRARDIAELITSDHKMMADVYEVEFRGDAKQLTPIVNATVRRDGVTVQMSPRRPF